MPTTKLSAAAIAMIAAFATPVLAQSTNSMHGAAPPMAPTTTAAPAASSDSSGPSGSLTKSHGDFRTSQIVGASVYNDKNDSIGTVDNLLMDDNGKVAQAVISVGGFLGVGSKLIAVPFDQLKFSASAGSSTSDTARHATNAVTPSSMHVASSSAAGYYSVTLPGATKDSLKSMPDFSYNG